MNEEWDLHPEWADWIREVWKDAPPGINRVQYQFDDHPCRLAFEEMAKGAFERAGVEFRRIKTWIVLQKEEEGEGYIEGHPHQHYPLRATSLITYLTGGSPIYIEGVKTDIHPGMMLMFHNSTWHGVYKHKGPDRLALIATAL